MASNKEKYSKTTTSIAAKIAAISNDTVTQSVARKLAYSELIPLHKVVNNPLFASEDNKDNSAPSSSRSNTSSASNMAPVMTINTLSLDNQIVALTKVIERLAKHI